MSEAVQKIQKFLDESFARWVLDLGLTVDAVTDDAVVVLMRPEERHNRLGNMVSGQALMAAADTAMVLALYSRCGVPGATVDMNTQFLRPTIDTDVRITATVVRAGKSLAFARATLCATTTGKIVADSNATFALPKH